MSFIGRIILQREAVEVATLLNCKQEMPASNFDQSTNCLTDE
jgi:hypothetical protein